MKTYLTHSSIVAACLFAILSSHARPDGQGAVGEIEKEIPRLIAATRKIDFETRLKRRYGLTQMDLMRLHARGMDDAQITLAAQMSEASGRPLEEIDQMRRSEGLTWNEIAKRLGLHPLAIARLLALMTERTPNRP